MSDGLAIYCHDCRAARGLPNSLVQNESVCQLCGEVRWCCVTARFSFPNLEPPHVPFERAVLASPNDDAPRLVYADWLDEHDDPEFAAALRTDRAKEDIIDYANGHLTAPSLRRAVCMWDRGYGRLPALPPAAEDVGALRASRRPRRKRRPNPRPA